MEPDASGVASLGASLGMMSQRMVPVVSLSVEVSSVKRGGLRRSRSCCSSMLTVIRSGVVQRGTLIVPSRVSPVELSTSATNLRFKPYFRASPGMSFNGMFTWKVPVSSVEMVSMGSCGESS